MKSRGTPTPAFQKRAERGRAARGQVPRAAHETWTAASDRPDPLSLLEEQAATRVPDLVPIRYSRMLQSPFAFFRGAALIMAADLAHTEDSGITVQLCGDAHLSNFGLYASPERVLVFDMNDFDETLPGPWEWDVKRLAASFEVMGRHRQFSDVERQALTRATVSGYRKRMRKAAGSPVLTAWYDHLKADQVVELFRPALRTVQKNGEKSNGPERVIAQAKKRDSARALAKLAEVVDGDLRIRANPPLVVPLADLAPSIRTREENESTVRDLLTDYQTTLSHDIHPMREFEYVDMARRVGGVGSVGTRAWIVLLRGRDNSDPLFLQAKQAEASVLERFLPASEYAHHGERVVRGQRIMQGASDIFLGWQRVVGFDGQPRDFYVRQLHDWKGSADLENMPFAGALIYARICGETLARAHARAGDRVAIAGYLGNSDRFDKAIGRFASAYADQNERDFSAFSDAVASGRLTASSGE